MAHTPQLVYDEFQLTHLLWKVLSTVFPPSLSLLFVRCPSGGADYRTVAPPRCFTNTRDTPASLLVCYGMRLYQLSFTTPLLRLFPGEFVLVYGSLPSHISGDMHLNPGAELSDGLLHLHIIRAGVTRSQVLQVSCGVL